MIIKTGDTIYIPVEILDTEAYGGSRVGIAIRQDPSYPTKIAIRKDWLCQVAKEAKHEE
jgi:hypothetical protein